MASAAAVSGWWEAAKAAIAAYTGMSPEAFFTAVAMAAALYLAVFASSLFARAAPAPAPPRGREAEDRAFEPLPPAVQVGEVTEQELRAYDGSDPKKPLLMAIKGQIFDVTHSRMLYGPGGPYALFAGRDASRALAKMSFEPNDLTGDVSGLGSFEVEALQEWEHKFMGKYVKVGTIRKVIPVTEGNAAGDAGTSETERGINATITQSNHVPKESEEDGVARHVGAVEKPMEKSDADASTNNDEDAEVKPNELPLPDHDSKNTSSGDGDAMEKMEQTTTEDSKNTNNTEDAKDPEGKPGAGEGTMEKPNEVPAMDVKNLSCTDIDAVEKHKEETDAYVKKNTSSHQDEVEEPEGNNRCKYEECIEA